MQYGNPEWQEWVLGEAEAIKHIKYACVLVLVQSPIQKMDHDPDMTRVFRRLTLPTYANAPSTQTHDFYINHLQTYSNGLSEIILGKAIKQLQLPREEIVVITKVYYTVGRDNRIVFQGSDADGYVNQHGLSRKHIFDSVKSSLMRLGMDYIDVLLCHRFDYETPIEETMQALHDVVKAGYVRYIGMSSCHAYQCILFLFHNLPFAN
ncbi:hypothetical protein C0993_009611 [Termitomyces sp. T159_Od127]|nr:hypothetical protein C0993_009611 [Termitomyces sp. T159_Od127]